MKKYGIYSSERLADLISLYFIILTIKNDKCLVYDLHYPCKTTNEQIQKTLSNWLKEEYIRKTDFLIVNMYDFEKELDGYLGQCEDIICENLLKRYILMENQ